MKPVIAIAAVWLAAALMFAAVPPAAAQSGGCLTDSQIQSAIQSGKIKSWPRIKAMAGIPRNYQEVSDVRVCLRGGVPYYNVNVVSPDGKATKIVVSAIDGSR
jgi:hypothetical protein